MTQNADTSQEKSARHTPGPWTIEPMENWEKVIRITNEGDGYARLYVEVCRDDCDTEVAEANAHLIAAAPDMLAALKARALYMKYAESPNVFPVETPFGHDCHWCSECFWKMIEMEKAAIAKAEKL